MLRFFQIFQNLGTPILFIFLECTCLFLIIRYNKGQREIFLHSSNELVSGIVRHRARIKQSLDLKIHNDELLDQNARLIEELVNSRPRVIVDSALQSKYSVIPANVINRSIYSRNNHITLDIGRNDGIDKTMGVLGSNGIVGVIKQVSAHYSTVISLLNVDLRISTAIKDKGYSGYLIWSGNDFFSFKLHGIPKHANIVIGDEIVTSGHSTIFPMGIYIGKVDAYTVVEGGAFYDINARIDQDLTKSDQVYVINNKDFEEIRDVERSYEN